METIRKIRRRGSRRIAQRVCAVVALVPAAAALSWMNRLPPATHINWPAYLLGPGHSSYQRAATAITPANAASLVPAWTWAPEPPPGHARLTGLLSSPTVYDGVIYAGAENGDFYAIKAATGAVLWRDVIGFVRATTCTSIGFVSTATVAPDPGDHRATVYVATPTGYLDALDAATGRLVWKSVIGLPSKTVNNYFDWSSPTIARGTVYVGISSQCDEPLVRGGLAAFSQSTGRRTGTFYSVPRGDVGGSIWSSPAVDSAGEVFVTTGNGPDSGCGTPSGPCDPTLGYSESIVALSGPALRPAGSWQIPASPDEPDSDFGASPTLFSATLPGAGSRTPLVGACNKNGHFYALDRGDIDAGPVWSTEIGDSAIGTDECIAAAVWDGRRLYAQGPATEIGGTLYPGSLRSLDPADGATGWEIPLPGDSDGSPSLDGSGVLAAPTYGQGSSAPSATYLIDARNGRLLATLNSGAGREFAQPVFAGRYLFLATVTGLTAFKVP